MRFRSLSRSEVGKLDLICRNLHGPNHMCWNEAAARLNSLSFTFFFFLNDLGEITKKVHLSLVYFSTNANTDFKATYAIESHYHGPLFSVISYSVVPELLWLSGKYGVYPVTLALVSVQLPFIRVGEHDSREDPYLQSEQVWQGLLLQHPAWFWVLSKLLSCDRLFSNGFTSLYLIILFNIHIHIDKKQSSGKRNAFVTAPGKCCKQNDVYVLDRDGRGFHMVWFSVPKTIAGLSFFPSFSWTLFIYDCCC